MAVSNYGRELAFTASVDLTSSINCFVTTSAGGEVGLPDANGRAIGVHTGPGVLDETTGVVCEFGAVIPVIAGAAIADNALVATDVAGKAITAVGETAQVLGTALGAATAAGEIISVLFQPTGFATQPAES